MDIEGRPPRILVVDDEPLVAMLIEDMLLDLGFEVVGPALHLERAIALLDSETVDVAILDVNLGLSRSYPVAERLAASGIPFAFATGYGSPGAEWQMRVPLLRKPFESSALGCVIAELLGKHKPPN